MKLSLVGLFMSASLAGCGSGSPAVELLATDSEKPETIAVGDEADLVLQTVGPGAYGDPVLSSDAVRFLGVSIEAPNPAGPLQRFRFMAVKPGTVSVHIPHTEQLNGVDLVIMVGD